MFGLATGDLKGYLLRSKGAEFREIWVSAPSVTGEQTELILVWERAAALAPSSASPGNFVPPSSLSSLLRTCAHVEQLTALAGEPPSVPIPPQRPPL